MIGAAVAKKLPPTPDKCQCCEAVEPEFPDATSPFCVGCSAKRRCPAQSPLSGYEPVYMPRLYNAKKYTQHNHNCFAYAFDIMDLPSTEECNGNDKEDCKVPFHQPGYYSGKQRFDESGEKRCFDLFSRLKGDMPAIEIARNGRPIEFTDKPAKGYSKIALVIDPKQDYHFYRQDSNGFWSHKPGGTPVTNKDTTGRLIYNPALANRDNRDDAGDKDGLNYNVFCGFMCVPRTLPNRAKRGGSLSGPKRGGGKGKTRRSVRGGMSVSKEMLPWLRKTQRLVGGMNNNNTMNGNPNNGYGANTDGKSRGKTKSRTYKIGKSVKAVKAAKVAPGLALSTDPNMAVRKMMAIVHNLKSTYSDIEITKDDEKAFRDIARSSVLPKYNPGKLFGMIQKKYGRVNPTIASEVRNIFRDADFLPIAGATQSKTQRKTTRGFATTGMTRSKKPTTTINPYADPRKGTRVGAVTAKLRSQRELADVIKTTGATKEQINAAVKNIAASGMPVVNRAEALKTRLIAEHKQRLSIDNLGTSLLTRVNLGKKKSNWSMSNTHAAALAEARESAPYTGFYMKPATFIAPGGIGGPHPHYTAPVAPPSRASSNNEGWGGEGNNDNSLETAMAALAGLGL